MWFYAAAYACTGAVRNSSDQLAVLYFVEQLKLDIATSRAVHWTMYLMPFVAVFGSLASGIISDKFFKGHRAPVAMGLYFLLSLFVLVAAGTIFSGIVGPTPLGVFLGCLFLVLISLAVIYAFGEDFPGLGRFNVDRRVVANTVIEKQPFVKSAQTAQLARRRPGIDAVGAQVTEKCGNVGLDR